MERKIAKLLAFTGVAISAAMALTPLTSYAIVNQHGYNCDPSNPSTLTNADGWGIGNDTTGGCASQTSGAKPVTLNVESQISLDAVSGTIINVTPHVLGTGEISATVSSSHPYTISLSSGQPNLTNTINGALNIPAKSSFTKDDNAWGIKKQDASDYSAITTAPVVYYTSTTPASSATSKFEVGVAVNEQTAPGTYQTDVIVTAAIKQ